MRAAVTEICPQICLRGQIMEDADFICPLIGENGQIKCSASLICPVVYKAEPFLIFLDFMRVKKHVSQSTLENPNNNR